MAFDSKPDMWWSHAGFRCDEAPAGQVTFGGILLKVPSLLHYCRDYWEARLAPYWRCVA